MPPAGVKFMSFFIDHPVYIAGRIHGDMGGNWPESTRPKMPIIIIMMRHKMPVLWHIVLSKLHRDVLWRDATHEKALVWGNLVPSTAQHTPNRVYGHSVSSNTGCADIRQWANGFQWKICRDSTMSSRVELIELLGHQIFQGRVCDWVCRHQLRACALNGTADWTLKACLSNDVLAKH